MHKPKKFDSVHQIVSPCETVGSGDETNPKGWRLKHLQGTFRTPEVEILLHKVMLGIEVGMWQDLINTCLASIPLAYYNQRPKAWKRCIHLLLQLSGSSCPTSTC